MSGVPGWQIRLTLQQCARHQARRRQAEEFELGYSVRAAVRAEARNPVGAITRRFRDRRVRLGGAP